jgi:hypothetical protein
MTKSKTILHIGKYPHTIKTEKRNYNSIVIPLYRSGAE